MYPALMDSKTLTSKRKEKNLGGSFTIFKRNSTHIFLTIEANKGVVEKDEATTSSSELWR